MEIIKFGLGPMINTYFSILRDYSVQGISYADLNCLRMTNQLQNLQYFFLLQPLELYKYVS